MQHTAVCWHGLTPIKYLLPLANSQNSMEINFSRSKKNFPR